MIQEIFHLCRAHRPRMTPAMKQNELADPVAIGALGTGAEVATPQNDGNLVKKVGQPAGLPPHKCHSFGWLKIAKDTFRREARKTIHRRQEY